MSGWLYNNTTYTLTERANQERKEALKRHDLAVLEFAHDMVVYIPTFVLESAKLAKKREILSLCNSPPFATQCQKTTRFLLGESTLDKDDWDIVQEQVEEFLRQQPALRWQWLREDLLKLVWCE